MPEDTEKKPESLFEAPPMAEQERMVEAMLFASADPLDTREMAARMPHGCDPAEALVLLRKRYEGRGVRLVRVGDGWAMRTASMTLAAPTPVTLPVRIGCCQEEATKL